MSCVQTPEVKNKVQEMFTAMENEKEEVDFCGFMLQVASLAIICKELIDDLNVTAK